MASPQRIEWRRRPPRRGLSNLGWYGVIAVLAVACVWLLFGDEPRRADGGDDNPLAALPLITTALSAAGAVAMAVPVLRRPVVAANHYALLVRPGSIRLLALPWAGIEEIRVARAGHERYLVVRQRMGPSVAGASPGWFDQGPLRRLRRAGGGASRLWTGYDVAVPMRDFVGGAAAALAALAAFAPDTVAFRQAPDDDGFV